MFEKFFASYPDVLGVLAQDAYSKGYRLEDDHWGRFQVVAPNCDVLNVCGERDPQHSFESMDNPTLEFVKRVLLHSPQRFLVFAFAHYYPIGGLGDVKITFATEALAIAAAKFCLTDEGFDEAYVLDRETWRRIEVQVD